jgi:hypothetical protein
VIFFDAILFVGVVKKRCGSQTVFLQTLIPQFRNWEYYKKSGVIQNRDYSLFLKSTKRACCSDALDCVAILGRKVSEARISLFTI